MKKRSNVDDFWDISSLVPTSPKTNNYQAKKITTVEVTVHNGSSNQECDENTLTNIKKSVDKPPAKNTFEYIPENKLIQKVEISDWDLNGNYYQLFCKQARQSRQIPPKKCEHIHFFSYMPQFSQMTRPQLDWYVWWRSCVNQKNFPDTDVTYILLYVFELINLANDENAQQYLDIMIDLWSNYRDIYPQLNKTLGEWICDFSLIHRLQINFTDSRLTRDMMTSVSIPEMFFGFDFSDIPLLTNFLLSFCNSYNYRKSKAYTEQTAQAYEKHIPVAMQRVVRECNWEQKIFSETVKKVKRTAFMGALCQSSEKKRIEIFYTSLALEHELRTEISDTIKYAENKLRGLLGIRSKLGIKNVNNTTKSIIDSYFDSDFKKIYVKPTVPEYEMLYETKQEPLSFEAANLIEQSSWMVTKKLVEAFEEEIESPSTVAVDEMPPHENLLSFEKKETNRLDATIERYKDLFELIKHEKYKEQIAYIKEKRIIVEAVIDEINDASAEVLGDILVEEAEIGYKLIDDYKDFLNNE